jgi:hypothetical protein
MNPLPITYAQTGQLEHMIGVKNREVSRAGGPHPGADIPGNCAVPAHGSRDQGFRLQVKDLRTETITGMRMRTKVNGGPLLDGDRTVNAIYVTLEDGALSRIITGRGKFELAEGGF